VQAKVQVERLTLWFHCLSLQQILFTTFAFGKVPSFGSSAKLLLALQVSAPLHLLPALSDCCATFTAASTAGVPNSRV